MAIEDGVLLARAIDEVAGQGGASVQKALQRYQAVRIECTSKIVRGSAANAERFHNPVLAHAEGAARLCRRAMAAGPRARALRLAVPQRRRPDHHLKRAPACIR
ncbi:MAG: hypothetical protein MO853_03160 [Candidatus Protistobacter heckmanni]|nr:hypothetical protein [Candidatus Protistobacter heckmanni]